MWRSILHKTMNTFSFALLKALGSFSHHELPALTHLIEFFDFLLQLSRVAFLSL